MDPPLFAGGFFPPPLLFVGGFFPPPGLLPPSRELGLLVGWLLVPGSVAGVELGCAEIVTDGVFVGDAEMVTEGVFVGVLVWDGVAAATLVPGLFMVSSEPAAPCGHQTTRQAARASSPATPMRTKFVLAVLTTSS